MTDRTRLSLLVILLGIPQTVSAQTSGPMVITQGIETPRAEIAAALQIAAFDADREPGRTAPGLGWSFSANGNLATWLAAVLEADGFADAYDTPDRRPGVAPHQAVNHVHAFLAGPRLQSSFFRVGPAPKPTDIRVFAQVLIGVRTSQTLSSGRAIQTGAGVDAHTRRGLIVRSEFDFCSVSSPGAGLSGSRWLFGLVFGPS